MDDDDDDIFIVFYLYFIMATTSSASCFDASSRSSTLARASVRRISDSSCLVVMGVESCV